LQALREVNGAGCNNSVRVCFTIHQRDNGCHGTLEINPDYPQGHFYSGLWSHVDYAVFTNEGDIASTKYGLPTLQTMGTNTSSVQSFKTAQRWLHSCIDEHPGAHHRRPTNFRSIFGKPNFDSWNRPALLIDVFADGYGYGSPERESLGRHVWNSSNSTGDEFSREGKEMSKIVDGTDILGPYLALSYQWGSHSYDGYITTNSNLLARKLNIVENELPKTFQHAIHAARRLGVRYLWIDAVCIIQHTENDKDWLEESAKMGSIFGNALLTLVAAAGDNSEAGLFNALSTYGGERFDRLTLSTILPGGTICSTLYCVPGFWSDNMALRAYREFSPLLNRAWCLQEDLLSARKLYYTSDQLYWHCDHLAISEDGLACGGSASSFDIYERLDNVKESDKACRASYIWYEGLIRNDYGKRIASKTTDKLIAVAGLARHVATVVKSRYLARLWEVSILEGLLWYSWYSEGHKKQKEYCAPTWSWASQDGGVYWPSRTKHDPLQAVSGCQYLRADIKLLSSDEFGGVSSAALTLCSRVFEFDAVARVRNETFLQMYLCLTYYQGIWGNGMLDEEISLPDTRVVAIPITHKTSLLVVKNSSSETHCRIGTWEVQDGTSERRPNQHTENYLRWTKKVLQDIPVTEITII
jgi:hypothetical protein